MSAVKVDESRRTHARYPLLSSKLARVVFYNNHPHAIRDISYAGFSVATSINRMSSTAVRLELLDQSVEATAHLVHSNEKFTGFSLQHKTVETLIFLQPFLESLRLGSTMNVVNSSSLETIYQSPDWVILRGEGGSELRIKVVQEKLDSLHLSIVEEERISEFHVNDGQRISTLKSGGVADHLAREGSQIDRAILRRALFILAGCDHPHAQLAKNTCLNHLPPSL